MGSSRLPGKVLADVAGRPMLARQIERLRRVPSIDEIVLATSRNPHDDPVVALARRESVRWYRGPEDDVLARFVGAVRETAGEIVVRSTADCPLIDPHVADNVVAALRENATPCDYASNVIKRTYPRGMDVEVLWRDTLLRLDRLAVSASAREHVTTFARWERPDLFLLRSVTDGENHADLRWTVDSVADLRYIQQLWRELDVDNLSYRELVQQVRSRPELQRFDEDDRSQAAA
jgi:spore coat polysaccharide biosynthesis protein SpsF (cytidylyltransferase family)